MKRVSNWALYCGKVDGVSFSFIWEVMLKTTRGVSLEGRDCCLEAIREDGIELSREV